MSRIVERNLLPRYRGFTIRILICKIGELARSIQLQQSLNNCAISVHGNSIFRVGSNCASFYLRLKFSKYPDCNERIHVNFTAVHWQCCWVSEGGSVSVVVRYCKKRAVWSVVRVVLLPQLWFTRAFPRMLQLRYGSMRRSSASPRIHLTTLLLQSPSGKPPAILRPYSPDKRRLDATSRQAGHPYGLASGSRQCRIRYGAPQLCRCLVETHLSHKSRKCRRFPSRGQIYNMGVIFCH